MSMAFAPVEAGAAALRKSPAVPAFAGTTEKSAIDTAKSIRSSETTALLECDAAIGRFPMLPATSFPIGTDPDGLPIGVQAIADTLKDHLAIAIARLAHGVMQ